MPRNIIKVLLSFLIALFMLLGLYPPEICLAASDRSAAQILYVKPAQSGDCLSWDTACGLQTALGIAQAGDQIWVAAGTYKPTEDNNRYRSFVLRSGVAIYGGFLGDETTLSDRDWETNPTILSGDIGGDGYADDNSINVVFCGLLDENPILDGFTITGGNANDGSILFGKNGGGLFLLVGSPLLTNLIITSNSAESGAGLSNMGGQPILTNVVFISNIAQIRGGGISTASENMVLTNVKFIANEAMNGGGMYIGGGSASLTNISFNGNHAWYGGGLYNSNTSPSINNVTFWNNYAMYDGGGLLNNHSSPALENCTFHGNIAGGSGAGIYNESSSNPVLVNVTISNNTAYCHDGGNGGGIFNTDSSSTLTNAILWGNSPNAIYGGTSTVNYSIVQGGFSGTGNLSSDPLLGGMLDNGGYAETRPLSTGSPAIDAGNPSVCQKVDQRGFTRPVDGDGNGSAVCDMGSYEYNAAQAEFSLAFTKVGNGNASVAPDQEYYFYGDVVTLTATAETGWSFSDWSGDVVGLINPKTIVILGDESTTATFTEDEYTLTVAILPEGYGSVIMEPDQSTYHYGDSVTITATADLGSTFSRWTGDATGKDNPLTLSVYGDTQITAEFYRFGYLPIFLR